MGKKKHTDDRSMSPVLAIPQRKIIPPRVFRSMYPLSYALGLKLVSVAGNDYEGFDIDEVEKRIGTTNFVALNARLKQVFCCGHRIWPTDYPDPTRRNCEVHCVYAQDLEEFLKNQRSTHRRDQDGSLQADKGH